MNADQAQLIRDGWEELAPRVDEVAQAFYAKLFALAPEARAIFVHVDMAAQRRKFLDMLTMLVRLADDPADLLAASIPLAHRHMHYGVNEQHLTAGRQALIETIEGALGERLTPEAHRAWAHFYDLATAVMRRAQQRTATSFAENPPNG
jgi:hemoglobin-like flavoprotein